MDKKEPVRLLILENSQNRAEEFIVLLRNAGRATRAHQIESDADLASKLKEQAWDLMIASGDVGELTPEMAIKQVRSLEKDVPVLIVAENRDPDAITEGLKMGAVDVALADDDERTLLIIERELFNLDMRRQKRRAEVELRETERRNQLLLESSNAAIAYVHEGMHIYTNSAYIELFGYEEEDDLVAIPIIDLIDSEDQGNFKELLKTFDKEEAGSDELSCVTADGSTIDCTLSLTPATYDGEHCMQVIFKTEQQAVGIEDKIKEISSQDSLTGLFNRQYFAEQLELAIDQASSGKNDSILFYIEVDNFSNLRSDAGISNSDLVFADVAALVRRHVPEEHLVSRFGDDVFSVLFRSGDKEQALTLAEQVRKEAENHLPEVSGRTYPVTLSIGLSSITENAPNSEEIISRAHQAADSMEDGNGVNFYQPTQVTVGEDGKALTGEHIKELLKDAIKENKLKLVFQPIISLHGEDDEQFEVLLRMFDEEGNELLPGDFLGPAEEAGLLEKVDRWVVLNSVKRLAEAREGGGKARLFVNITYKSIADETFLPWLGTALKAAKLPSDTIILQIHENDATGYIKHAAKFAKGMAQLHCKTSINHFGCSLNPMNLLKHFTPDFVKLDGSYAENLEGKTEKIEEITEVVNQLQTAGVLTALSGVEEPGILPTLWQVGVNYIQGYYISPPLDVLEYDFADEGL